LVVAEIPAVSAERAALLWLAWHDPEALRQLPDHLFRALTSSGMFHMGRDGKRYQLIEIEGNR
jgi:hypothetical protein